MTDYDYKSYEKCLEKVLESTQKDYWAQYIDINRHQVMVGRTYLWVSAALIGAYTAGYQQFDQILSNTLVLLFLYLAFSFSVIAFGICLYAMPARKGYLSVHKDGWGEFSHKAYKLLNEKKNNLYASFLTDFISKFDVAHRHSLETNQKRAKLLRLTSWLLILSFVLAIVSIVTIATNNNIKHKKEIVMTESNNKPSSPSAENTPASTEKPDVPVPPPPAGTQGGQIHTHSADLPRVIRATEDVGTKSKHD